MEVLEPAEISNNALARKNLDFVTSEISELLSSGRIREVSHNDVHTINPLSVANNGEKLKLILDLRHVNQLLRVPKIKFEDIRTIRDQYNQQSDNLFKFDIKPGYLHIDILAKHQQYLARLQMENRGGMEILCLYCFSVWLELCPLHFYKGCESAYQALEKSIKPYEFLDSLMMCLGVRAP